MSLKKAPQVEVLSIERTGSWGRVEYRHRLVCGHTEVRKRPSSAPKIGCSWCVKAEEKQQELQALATPQVVLAEVPLDDPFYDPDVEHDVESGWLKAGLVLALGLGQESVEVVSEVGDDGQLSARYVVVFMDIPTAMRIAGVDSRPSS